MSGEATSCAKYSSKRTVLPVTDAELTRLALYFVIDAQEPVMRTKHAD